MANEEHIAILKQGVQQRFLGSVISDGVRISHLSDMKRSEPGLLRWPSLPRQIEHQCICRG